TLGVETEDTRGVTVQEEGIRLLIEAGRGEVLQAAGGRPGGMVRPEHDLLPSVPAEVLDELARIAADGVGGRIDVDVRILRRERDHLRRPRIADVPADDPQLGELEGDTVEVGDGPSGRRGTERAGVPDLETERDPQHGAFGVERIVAAIVRWQIPEPGDDA